jgi:glycosyltransferase involved in cell wall biosynthesis
MTLETTMGQLLAPEIAWPVMILAHNEEKHIAACLDSVYAAEPGRTFAIFVMANGCTDNTEAIVAQYAQTHEGVNLVSLSVGDKNNAWNVFVHEVAPARTPESEIYFFMDGDARACPGALSELTKGLRSNPHAHAASALPASGRSMRRDRNEMIRDHGLVANLYALRGDFVRRLRQQRVKLPMKLEGDDGLLGALIKWDLDPTREWDKTRIAPCPKAGFVFESFAWANPLHWSTYWRRAVRYGRRAYEFQLLGNALKSGGIGALPTNITELYPLSFNLKLRWAGPYTITNWVALREMRQSSRKVDVPGS